MPAHRITRVALAAAVLPAAGMAQDGKALFTLHCAACHLPDRQLVGPSLVEVTKLYTGKPAEFLAWCNDPQQKRPGVIQMPPMGHVGEENLLAIHSYILEASKGLEEVKVKGVDPYYASPSMRKRPQVQRIFMPNAGPAAIAVAVNDDLHYCWDAGECRLRYAWKGDFIDGWSYWRGNGNGLAKIQGQVFLTEEQSPLSPKAGPPAKFLGYRLQDGLPVFRYRLGTTEITETIMPTADGQALQRTFTATGPALPEKLTLTPAESVTYRSEDGSWDGSVLNLHPDHRSRFSITITPQQP